MAVRNTLATLETQLERIVQDLDAAGQTASNSQRDGWQHGARTAQALTSARGWLMKLAKDVGEELGDGEAKSRGASCWRVGWYIRGIEGEEIVPELNWGQCTEGEGGGDVVRKMAQSIAVSLEHHARELDEHEMLRAREK